MGIFKKNNFCPLLLLSAVNKKISNLNSSELPLLVLPFKALYNIEYINASLICICHKPKFIFPSYFSTSIFYLTYEVRHFSLLSFVSSNNGGSIALKDISNKDSKKSKMSYEHIQIFVKVEFVKFLAKYYK